MYVHTCAKNSVQFLTIVREIFHSHKQTYTSVYLLSCFPLHLLQSKENRINLVNDVSSCCCGFCGLLVAVMWIHCLQIFICLSLGAPSAFRLLFSDQQNFSQDFPFRYVRTTSCCYCCWPLIGTAGVCMWRVSPLSRSGSPHYYVETTCEDYEQLRNSDSDNDNNTTTQQRNTIIVAVVVVVCSSKLIFVTKLIFIVFLILFKFQLRLAL